MIQYASNSKKIASPFDKVWTKDCQSQQKNYLEQRLFLIKEKRNSLLHKDEKFTNLSDTEMEKIVKKTRQQIKKIIKQAGRKANIDRGEIDRVNKILQDSIEHIRLKRLITSFEKHRILKFLKKEDIEANYLTELSYYFTGELKGFTTPNLLQKSDNSVSNLKDILQAIENWQVAIISGEAGCGKTSLTK